MIAAPNLNGDYLSDAVTSQVGGLGIAQGANIGDEISVFEPTHGSTPKYRGLDKLTPRLSFSPVRELSTLRSKSF